MTFVQSENVHDPRRLLKLQSETNTSSFNPLLSLIVIVARIGAIVSFPGPGTPGPEPILPDRGVYICIYIYSIYLEVSGDGSGGLRKVGRVGSGPGVPGPGNGSFAPILATKQKAYEGRIQNR